MSTQKLSLRHPAVIAVVLLALTGVVVLNVRTFKPQDRRPETSRGYRLQAHPAVPLDARPALYSAEEPAPGDKGAHALPAVDSLERDPFFPVRKQPQATRTANRNSRKETAAPRRPAFKPPVCSAVLLMGQRPMAVIDGKGYHPGETVRGMTVLEITAEAVLLKDGQGKIHRLGTGPQKNDESHYRVVTRTRGADEQGRTRLIDQ